MAENNGAGNKAVASPKKKKGMSFGLAAFVVGLGSIIVKFSGLIRDVILGRKFCDEAGIYRAAYSLAFTIPDLFFNLLIGGAIFSTVAPYLSAQLAVGKEKEGVRTISIFVSVVSVGMLVVCTLGTIFSEPIYNLYAIGKDDIKPEVLMLAAQASKFLFPQIFFIMLAALCNGILISYRRFTITSFGPLLYNILVIVAVIIFGGNSQKNLVMTTAGILVATAIYFVCQYSFGFRQMKQFRFIFKPMDKEFLQLFRRAIPILISASIIQINTVVLYRFALQFGEIHVWGYRNASTIWQIPYTVFVVAITTVMTPELAGAYKSNLYSKASELVSRSMKSALFMTIPSAAIIAVLSVDVVKAIYQWPSSNYTDLNAHSASTFLLGFCIAIVTATVVHVFNQAFYAIGQTRVPLISGLISLVMTPLSCQLLVTLGAGPISLSLAYSFANICQMIMLGITYCRRKELAPHGIVRFLLKAALCAAVMSAVVFIVNIWLPANGGKIMQLMIDAVKGVVAIVVYFAMAVILRMEEATEWINKFKAKIFKKSAVRKA
ncbi:murein biosynthesis integral membrane protein MurJ [Butyrivibrio sp. AE2032]|uniref:murein biosynthesis integral membrane protein MurJ n=1 Tax=Butyrivibrio sp. AE2032 TaxID=1458463 RepID=UPI000550DF8A|nr:lipid II flippase MurJ [Butyrivibrio sp. AE2032]